MPLQPWYADASVLMASCSAVRTPAGSVESDRKKRRAMATSAVNRAGTRDASCPIAWYVKPRTAVLVMSDPEDVSAQQPISVQSCFFPAYSGETITYGAILLHSA